MEEAGIQCGGEMVAGSYSPLAAESPCQRENGGRDTCLVGTGP